MPGNNCTIVGCSACKGRNRGLSFHGIPKRPDLAKKQRKDEPERQEWRRQLIVKINRVDPSFNPDTATICSRHFKNDCFITSATGKTFLKMGSLPTEFMPVPSVNTPQTSKRVPVVRAPLPPSPKLVAHMDLSDVRREAKKLRPQWLLTADCEDYIDIGLLSSLQHPSEGFKLYLRVTKDFSVSIHVYGLLMDWTPSVEMTKLSKFVRTLERRPICPGVTEPSLQTYAELPKAGCTYFRHVWALSASGCLSSVRSVKCHLLLHSDKESSLCSMCRRVLALLQRKRSRNLAPALSLNAKTPLQKVAKSKVAIALQETRRREKHLLSKVAQIEKRLKEEAFHVNQETHEELEHIISANSSKIEDSFIKLFWEQQCKAFKAQNHGMRWHPMMVRLAILLHSQSRSAYDSLRNTGVLKLPCESTLRDYTNIIHPKAGFNASVLDEVKSACKGLRPHQRFVVLLHDEMTLKSDLVFDRVTGEMVGYVRPSEWQMTDDPCDNVATHVLAFYIVGISSHLKMSLGFFPTKTATADALFTLLWKAIAYLEISCNLKVIASTSDKAGQNQKLYRMHNGGKPCFKAPNVYAEEERDIYFFSDAPHLVKTVRNNLYQSSVSGTKYLWNGSHILWSHIEDMYRHDASLVLRQTKLTNDHIHLTPHSKMTVKLAAQVLSDSVGRLMMASSNKDNKETARFILLMNKFFDCLNTRSNVEGHRKRNEWLLPYSSVDDHRFEFLSKEFLGYVDSWKGRVMNMTGDLRKAERNEMFLSSQTYEGLWMTVNSVIEATQYLLQHGVSYVHTNKFCQDPIEEHFGRHRSLGRRCDNPTLWAFGYQENRIRLQRSLSLALKPRGSVKGVCTQEKVIISQSPLKKRHYQKQNE